MSYRELANEVANLIAAEMYQDDFNIKLNQWLIKFRAFDRTTALEINIGDPVIVIDSGDEYEAILTREYEAILARWNDDAAGGAPSETEDVDE